MIADGKVKVVSFIQDRLDHDLNVIDMFVSDMEHIGKRLDISVHQRNSPRCKRLRNHI